MKVKELIEKLQALNPEYEVKYGLTTTNVVMGLSGK